MGPEDHLVTREAKEYWGLVPRARQAALERVYAAVESGELHSWEQVPEYFLPPDDPNDSHLEGEEIDLYNPAMAPEWEQGEDSDAEQPDMAAEQDGDESDDSAPADKKDALAESAAAAPSIPLAESAAAAPDPHPAGPLVPAESAVAAGGIQSAEARALVEKLAEYDSAIQYASQNLKDEVLARQARDRKQAFWRRARHMDPEVIEAASAEMQEKRDELQELRQRIREEDAKKEAARQARLAAERLRKEKAAAQSAEAKMRRDLYLSLDRPWDPKDFGQGSKQLTAPAVKNIREALERCRLRAPLLPKDLDAMWTMFLDRYPAYLRAEYGAGMGNAFVSKIWELMKDLGGDFQHRPLSAARNRAPRAGSSAASAASAGGNPKAFAEFVRSAILRLVGRLEL